VSGVLPVQSPANALPSQGIVTVREFFAAGWSGMTTAFPAGVRRGPVALERLELRHLVLLDVLHYDGVTQVHLHRQEDRGAADRNREPPGGPPRDGDP